MSWRHLGLLLLLVPVGGLVGVALAAVPPRVLIPPLIAVAGLAGMAGVASSLGITGPRPLGADPSASPQDPRPVSPADRRRGVRRGLTAAGVSAVVVLAVAGLAVVAGPATGPLLLLAGFAAAGWAWSRVRRHLARRSTGEIIDGPVPPRRRPGTPRPLEHEFASLSTPALGREWQLSLHALHATTDPDGRQAVVDLRRRYLDELERRDPVALERWLAVDPGPGRDPTRWFSPSPDVTDPPAPEEHSS